MPVAAYQLADLDEGEKEEEKRLKNVELHFKDLCGSCVEEWKKKVLGNSQEMNFLSFSSWATAAAASSLVNKENTESRTEFITIIFVSSLMIKSRNTKAVNNSL